MARGDRVVIDGTVPVMVRGGTVGIGSPVVIDGAVEVLGEVSIDQTSKGPMAVAGEVSVESATDVPTGHAQRFTLYG
jgi:UDP-3-O-[3-hydroxymyristoyl] glucosamine N-acyltransferase